MRIKVNYVVITMRIFFGGVWKGLMRLKVNYVITTMRKPHKNDDNHQCDQPSSVTCLIPIHSVLEQVF